MDLLDHLRQEAGDTEATRREGVLGIERGNAPALLLARVPSPLRVGLDSLEDGICERSWFPTFESKQPIQGWGTQGLGSANVENR
ncbi:MAG TPA: hypothetical protein VN670_05025 [Acidobacteriaceae bacterium]|nr:hypothetical protein [Acidobacteriaceae bacterium]